MRRKGRKRRGCPPRCSCPSSWYGCACHCCCPTTTITALVVVVGVVVVVVVVVVAARGAAAVAAAAPALSPDVVVDRRHASLDLLLRRKWKGESREGGRGG